MHSIMLLLLPSQKFAYMSCCVLVVDNQKVWIWGRLQNRKSGTGTCLTLHSPVVTICTTSLTLKNSTFCPHSIFMCFVWIWEQKAIISLYSIDWLIFITDGVCLLCGTFYVLPTHCIYVFCVDLRANSDYFTVQHWLVGFYNWDGVCLLRGTFYVLPTVYLCVLCGSENKQWLFHCTTLTGWFL